MAVTSNAKAKLCECSDELLSMLNDIGVNVSKFVESTPKYKAISDNDKLCKKKWQQKNREKCKAYWRKYILSEKGQHYLDRLKQRMQDPEYKEKRNARSRELYILNKDKINARRKELRELHKTPESMEKARERQRIYYANNKEKYLSRKREYYRKKKYLKIGIPKDSSKKC